MRNAVTAVLCAAFTMFFPGGCASTITGGQMRHETVGGVREQVSTGGASQSRQEAMLVRVTADAVEIHSDRALAATTQPSQRLFISQPSHLIATTQPSAAGHGSLPKITATGKDRLSAVEFQPVRPFGIFYTGAILLGVAGIVAAVKFHQWTLGGCLGAAAAASALAPSFIEQWAPLLAWLVGALLLAGVVFVIGKAVQGNWLRSQAMAGVVKLTREGRGDEAIAAARAADPKLDSAFLSAGEGGNRGR